MQLAIAQRAGRTLLAEAMRQEIEAYEARRKRDVTHTRREEDGHMATKFIVRQGDVVLIRVDRPNASEIVKAPADPRGIVLAEGETSGHFHSVFAKGSKQLFHFRDTSRQERLLSIGRGGAEVRVVGGESGGVPRHEPISIPTGTYLVRTQRFWSLEDERSVNVQD